MGNTNFGEHVDSVEASGFELFEKRARVGQSKHMRVRPLFREGWTVTGDITVIDEKQSGIKKTVLQLILDQAGQLVGLGDWRPGSPRAPGPYGRFQASIS